MKIKKRWFSTTIIIAIFVLCSTVGKVTGQLNLVESSDNLIIYSGNLFNIKSDKSDGSELIFSINNLDTVKLTFNYVSEFESAGIFMNSIDDLVGKGYSLTDIPWTSIGDSSSEKCSINTTKNGLTNNASIGISTNVYSSEQTIRNIGIEAFQETFIDFSINNWTFSPDTSGIAINIIMESLADEQAARFGPYIEGNNHVTKIITENNDEFIVESNKNISLILNDGSMMGIDSLFFANYNIAAYEKSPADFWISIPYRSDIAKIAIGFVVKYNFENSGNASFVSGLFVAGTLVIFTTMVLLKRNRRKEKC